VFFGCADCKGLNTESTEDTEITEQRRGRNPDPVGTGVLRSYEGSETKDGWHGKGQGMRGGMGAGGGAERVSRTTWRQWSLL
jgi:hypothetical protein